MSHDRRTPPAEEGRTWTIDELASHFGLTVRTTRYYAGLGLIPPPVRRGRMAYYDERHRARLEIVRTLQDQGMTLAAIESHLAHLDETTSVPELEMRRALLSGWAPTPPEVISPEELNRRAGRVLDNEQLGFLQRLTAINPVEGGFAVRPTLNVGLQLLDVDLSIPSLESAGEAIRRHMESLALELREILRTQVINPLREQEYDADPAEFARTMRSCAS